MHSAIDEELVLACHDLSEGGLALAVAEMAFSGDVGIEFDLDMVSFAGKLRRHDSILFSESNTRFLVEIRKENVDRFVELFHGLPIARIGSTVKDKHLRIFIGKRKIVDLPLLILRKKWQRRVV
jgi:phosphoribosylformylglycinamidine synthase